MNDADNENLAIANDQRPLAGRTVLLTRPRKQSEEMAYQLERLGAQVIHAPMIATVAPQSWVALDAAIEKLDTYDAIIFTSGNGVAFFLQRLREKRPECLTQIKEIPIYAIGKATAKALAEAELTAGLVASDSKAEGFVNAIIEYVGGETQLRGQRFLFPRAQLARELLPEELRKCGAIVDTVETYQTVRPPLDDKEIIALLENKKIDVITFTSSSTVHHFIATLGEASLTELLRDTLLACIGPITAATAKAYKLTNIIQPASYNAEALVEAIREAFTVK